MGMRSGNGLALYPGGSYKTYESTNFVVGSSPATLSVKTDLGLGKDANNGYITTDGPGTILVQLAKGGTTFGDSITLYPTDVLDIKGEGITQIKITHSGTDSSYRVFVE